DDLRYFRCALRNGPALQESRSDGPRAGYFEIVCSGRRGGRGIVSIVCRVASLSCGGEILRLLRIFPAVRIAACVLVAMHCLSLRAQQVPPASAARILLVPRRMISGERATLAVLDVNGRLTPG